MVGLLTPSTNYDNSRCHDGEQMSGRQGRAESLNGMLGESGRREADEDYKKRHSEDALSEPQVGEVPRLRQSGRKRKLMACSLAGQFRASIIQSSGQNM